jgi:hypothetical protein
MPQRIRLDLILIFSISISLFGSFTTLMFALHTPTIKGNFLLRKPLVGLIFTSICTSGIIAVLIPKKCSGTPDLPKTEKTIHEDKDPRYDKVTVTFKGHHPDCGRYSAHVIQINTNTLCAACTGLLLGALIALAGTALYFFVGWSLGQAEFPALLLGQAGVVLGFLQFKFRGYTRSTVNVFFVIATFLTLIGIDNIVKNTIIDLYSIALIVFWLWTRILISQWDHWRICHNCQSPCPRAELAK